LVVTNDFPPRQGGIQTFVAELLARQPHDSVVVYASDWRGSHEHDASLPYPVVRYPHRVMLPIPSVAAQARQLLAEYGCTSVLFGAAAPLGLLAGRLRDSGARRVVALTHGHEAGWAGIPGAAQMLRRACEGMDVTTYLGPYTRTRIAGALSPAAAGRLVQLSPGVDTEVFTPEVDARAVRQRHGLTERPVVVCVSRLMPRKGQDTLIDAWPRVQRAVPEAALLLVGGGPSRKTLDQRVRERGLIGDVVLTGSVPFGELPAHYAAGDVFAMPCRTRNRGLDVEGLGIVYLEASATGLPVVAGDSGGAPDAVLEGETGFVVPGGDPVATADRLIELLTDAGLRTRMGERGRAWVASDWRWDSAADRLSILLDPSRPVPPDLR
jgi:phosphatidyl-myo-inositol dimannoside synthase